MTISFVSNFFVCVCGYALIEVISQNDGKWIFINGRPIAARFKHSDHYVHNNTRSL